MIRIAIVNDLRLAQEVLRRTVELITGCTLAWIAADGREALEKCRQDRPDLILMDMVMPVMDGAVATRAIMKECPCPILVVTSTIEGNLTLVYEALGAGAIDAVHTPTITTGGTIEGVEALARKVRVATIGSPPQAARPSTPTAGSCGDRSQGAPYAGVPLIAIGSSTGGPHALSEVLRGLQPIASQCCVLIVQHIDFSYVAGLASWLGGEIHREVSLATDGEAPLAGKILLAATMQHMVLSGGRLRYHSEAGDDLHKPSVDVLFESLARDGSLCGTAALLTGMGRDGARGLRCLRESGWHTIAQDEMTSVVWGMPGTAVAMGAAVEVLPLGEIGRTICATATARTYGHRA